jgi:hypothetical protein
MYKRLANLPAYRSTRGQVSARRYNQVHIALNRLGTPLRFPIPGLRNLQMILDDESWVCVDASLNDMPVVAWTEFQAQGRDNLHEDIACRISRYHTHADLIQETALRETENHLAQAMLPTS